MKQNENEEEKMKPYASIIWNSYNWHLLLLKKLQYIPPSFFIIFPLSKSNKENSFSVHICIKISYI